MTSVLLYFVSAVIILTGLAGSVLPMIPGVPLMFIGMLLAAYVGDFSIISVATIVVLLVLTLLSVALDYASGVIGAKFAGSSLAGILGGVLGAIFGFAILGPIGIFLGPAIGVFLFELFSRRSIAESTKSARFTLLSTVIGGALNIVIALVMVIILIVALLV